MKHLISIILSLGVLISCSTINFGPDKRITRFEGQKITGIKAGGAFKVQISQGESTMATVTIPENLEKHLVFDIDSQGVITVGLSYSLDTDKIDQTTFELDMVCTTLEEVKLSGASQVDILTPIQSLILDVDMSGASKLTANSAINVMGETQIRCSGASHFNFGSLTTKSGSVDLRGACNVMIKGSASKLKLDVSGASKLNCQDMITQVTECQATGASKISITANQEITGTASGASRISCYGSAKVNISTSGAASVSIR